MQPTLSRANFTNFRSIMLRACRSSIPRCTKLSFHTQSYRQFEDSKNETIGYRTKHFTIIIWLQVVSYLVSMFNTVLFFVTKMCVNCKHWENANILFHYFPMVLGIPVAVPLCALVYGHRIWETEVQVVITV